jgi:ribosomal protein L9
METIAERLAELDQNYKANALRFYGSYLDLENVNQELHEQISELSEIRENEDHGQTAFSLECDANDEGYLLKEEIKEFQVLNAIQAQHRIDARAIEKFNPPKELGLYTISVIHMVKGVAERLKLKMWVVPAP